MILIYNIGIYIKWFTIYVIFSKVTRRLILMEQEFIPFQIILMYSWFYNGARVTRSLVLCVYFVDRCLSFCTFFGNCVVCPSSTYGFRFPLWYLQTVLTLPENMSELTIVLGFVLVNPFCVVFFRSLFLRFSFSYCVVCPFSINNFLLALCHLQTFLSCRWLTNTRAINGIHCMAITLCYLLKIK